MNYTKLKALPVDKLESVLQSMRVTEETAPKEINALGRALCRLIKDSVKHDLSEPIWSDIRALSIVLAQDCIDIMYSLGKEGLVEIRESSVFLNWLCDFYSAMALAEKNEETKVATEQIIDENELFALLDAVLD